MSEITHYPDQEDLTPEQGEQLLLAVNQERAKVLKKHVPRKKISQILAYLESDPFDEMSPNFFQIVESCLKDLASDTYPIDKEHEGKYLGGQMELAQIGDTHNGIPETFDEDIASSGQKLHLRNLLAVLKCNALLAQPLCTEKLGERLGRRFAFALACYSARKGLPLALSHIENLTPEDLEILKNLDEHYSKRSREEKKTDAKIFKSSQKGAIFSLVQEEKLPENVIYNTQDNIDIIVGIMFDDFRKRKKLAEKQLKADSQAFYVFCKTIGSPQEFIEQLLQIKNDRVQL